MLIYIKKKVKIKIKILLVRALNKTLVCDANGFDNSLEDRGKKLVGSQLLDGRKDQHEPSYFLDEGCGAV